MDWDVSLVSWGMPSAPQTFSGYSASLAHRLRSLGHLRREYSAKNVLPIDALFGAVSLWPILSGRQPNLSRAWMWSPRGNAALSQRVNRRIAAAGDRGPFLEVGTLVRIDKAFGPQFQITDMTIAQARRAGYFGIEHLSKKTINVAERVQQETLKHARHLFAMSQWAAKSLIDDYGIPQSKITTIYAGSNMSLRANERPRKDFQILFVGSDWRRKGGPSVLEAFRLVRVSLPQATLRIVGPDPQVREPGVIVEGSLDRSVPAEYDKLCACYLEASCFCLPSAFDPFPIAIIDAMSCGLPVVAFDNGSRREVVNDGLTGRLVPEGDVAALGNAMREILCDAALRTRMSAESKRRVDEHFTWSKVVQRIGGVVAAHEVVCLVVSAQGVLYFA